MVRPMSDARVTVTLPDGSQKQTAAGTTIADFVREAIGPGLAKAAVLAKAGGVMVDLSRPLTTDTALEIFTTKSAEALDTIRHDAAHVVADAVQRLFPGTQVTIGPQHRARLLLRLRRRGQPFTEDELAQHRGRDANRIVAGNLPFLPQREVAPAEALALFGPSKGEAYKRRAHPRHHRAARPSSASTTHGDWTDICEGPHGPLPAASASSRLPAHARRRRLLARRPEEQVAARASTAWPSSDKKELETPPLALRGGEEARPPPARQVSSTCSCSTRSRPGRGVLAAPRDRHLQPALHYMRTLLLGDGYVEIRTPLIFNKGCGRSPATGASTRRTCSSVDHQRGARGTEAQHA
jgi:threonyl-tRNA synthetase